MITKKFTVKLWNSLTQLVRSQVMTKRAAGHPENRINRIIASGITKCWWDAGVFSSDSRRAAGKQRQQLFAFCVAIWESGGKAANECMRPSGTTKICASHKKSAAGFIRLGVYVYARKKKRCPSEWCAAERSILTRREENLFAGRFVSIYIYYRVLVGLPRPRLFIMEVSAGRREDRRDLAYKWQHHASRYARGTGREQEPERKRERLLLRKFYSSERGGRAAFNIACSPSARHSWYTLPELLLYIWSPARPLACIYSEGNRDITQLMF